MKHFGITLALLLALSAASPAKTKTHVSFEATLTRIEPWGPLKLSCGVIANYRLAEYRIDTAYDGKFTKGQVVVLKHLACNYNELDDLRIGDKVLVVAEASDLQDRKTWNNNIGKSSEPVRVEYRALSVGKLVYPTAEAPR